MHIHAITAASSAISTTHDLASLQLRKYANKAAYFDIDDLKTCIYHADIHIAQLLKFKHGAFTKTKEANDRHLLIYERGCQDSGSSSNSPEYIYVILQTLDFSEP